MHRIHATLIAVLIAAAGTAGLYAAVKTVRLGQQAATPSISAGDLAARKAKLAAWRGSLAAARAKRPPALPKLPHYAPVTAQPAAQPPAGTSAQPHVTYVQAPTVVTYKRAAAPQTATATSSWSDDSGGDDGGDSGGDD